MPRILLFLISFVCLMIGTFVSACADIQSDDNSVKQDKVSIRNSATGKKTANSETPKFEYVGYKPQYDQSYDEENAKHLARASAASTFSSAAYLTFYFFGFFPKTIEEMEDAGLIPFKLQKDSPDYEYVKWKNSFMFFSQPGSQNVNGRDSVRFRESVDLEDAPPSVQMEFKRQVLGRHFRTLRSSTPEGGFTIEVDELLLPGVADISGNLIGLDWETNERFYVNPYNGRPMRLVAWDSDSPGDYSVREGTRLKYEIKFHSES